MSSVAPALVMMLACLLFAGAAYGADLRIVRNPAQIRGMFPANAKLRVLNIWATWCVPCVEEMPDFRVIDETFGSEVAIAGVSLDDMIPGAKREKVVAFLDRQKIAFTNIYYTGNPDDLGDTIDFDGEIPITIVYDARGKEVWRHRGRIDRQKTIAQLRELLRRK